ncbi:hypothetical protein V8E36_009699 [Tilletia maclaganii]
MSRQLPPFVHRGSRAPSSVADGDRGLTAHIGGSSSSAYPRSSATPTPANFYHMNAERRPHPLQQAFYSDDFLPSGGNDGRGGPRSAVNGLGGSVNRDMPPPRHPSASHRNLEPEHDGRHIHRAESTAEQEHHQALMRHPQQQHDSEQQQDVSGQDLVLQCKRCQLIIGDSYDWIDLIQPLNLIVLSAAPAFLRSDGDPDPDDPPSTLNNAESSNVAGKRKAASAAPAGAVLHTSPADAPDAASTWHVLRCVCGAEVGRKYVSTSFPHLDALRGNHSFSLDDIYVYELGSSSGRSRGGSSHRYADADRSHSGMDEAAPSASPLLAEEMNKMRLMLMSIADRLVRVEDKLQMRPQPPSAHMPGSTPAPSGSSPMPYHPPVSGPGISAAGAHRGIRRVPNAQDAFLPPRIVSRTTATPAPASGPSLPDSLETSGPSSSSATSAFTLAATSHHHHHARTNASVAAHLHAHGHGQWGSQTPRPGGEGGGQGPSRSGAADAAGSHQDSSPYSSPLTPTPAPASQTVATTSRPAESSQPQEARHPPSASTSRSAQAGSVHQGLTASPNKRGAAQASGSKSGGSESKGTNVYEKARRKAEGKSAVVEEVAEDEEEEEDEFDRIVATPGSSSSPKRRRRDIAPGPTSSAPRDRGSPVLNPVGPRVSSRKSGGRNNLPTSSAPTSGVPIVAAETRGNKGRVSGAGGASSKHAGDAADTVGGDDDDDAMLVDMDDEDDELAIGADARMEAASDDDEADEERRGGGGGEGRSSRASRRRKTSGDAEGGANANVVHSPGGRGGAASSKRTAEEARAMPPPSLPSPSPMRAGTSGGSRSVKKTVAVA